MDATETQSPILKDLDFKKVDKFELWKRYLAYSYILINLADFIVLPVWTKATRPSLEYILTLTKLDPAAQALALQSLEWQPLTLANGGLFHIAMGAILTGVAVAGNKAFPSR